MKKIFRLVPTAIRERAAFIARTGYFPRFKKPITYNHKVNYRKFNWKNPLFVTCADKIAVKEYVAEKVGREYIIDNVFVGDRLSPLDARKLLDTHGALVVKANHNSGPVQFLSPADPDDRVRSICDNINHQLTIDYGRMKLEPWYSHIQPAVLVEKQLKMASGDDLWDYKFHIFNHKKKGDQTVLLHIDYDRHGCAHRSFFDEELNWLPFSLTHPCLKTTLERPENYEKMLEIAKTLGQPFSYARVDLYNVDGDIYFGEITFAHGAGRSRFSSIIYDKWMGKLWDLDPAM